jgi:hypothetical protein
VATLQDEAQETKWKQARPYSDVPGPKPLPIVGNTWRFLPFVGTNTVLYTYLLTYLLILSVPTGTQGLNNFTIVEVSIAVKFFTETGLLAVCPIPQPEKYPF